MKKNDNDVITAAAYSHARRLIEEYYPNNPSDDIKVDSTIKSLAKYPTVSERIIERLKTE